MPLMMFLWVWLKQEVQTEKERLEPTMGTSQDTFPWHRHTWCWGDKDLGSSRAWPRGFACGLGALRALVPTYQPLEHLTSATGACGRIKLPKNKCSISLFMGGNRDFSSLLCPAAFCSHGLRKREMKKNNHWKRGKLQKKSLNIPGALWACAKIF